MTNIKSALVIGGSTGIGRGVAEALSELGFIVHIISRSEPKDSNNFNFQWHFCNLNDTNSYRNTIEKIVADGLYFACFSAAFYGPTRCNFTETNWEIWNEQSTIMIDGLWITLYSVLPYLLKTKGIFLSISSEVSLNFGPGRAGYTACKAAALGLLGSIAAEITPDEILISQALPEGMVDSPGIRARRPQDFDYSAYMQPSDFKEFVKYLVTTKDHDLHGKTVMVSKMGCWDLVKTNNLPPSQSLRTN
ncbi:SDR family oxidoreductase [Photorhabdus asymbiotica]|uniref:SDR family oxidoreductase n=1 Tax=Photorhabdus asymbiotica TaxID=291112 RepID=UPI003DA77B37